MPTSNPILHIPTGPGCNNSCVFCIDRGGEQAEQRQLEEYAADLRHHRQELDDVTFTGGEPTLNPLLPDLISAAAGLGYRTIGVVTNGRLLRRRSLCADLLDRGMNEVTFSIHGPDAATHDAVTRRPGSFGQAIEGLGVVAGLRLDHGLTLLVNSTVVRANLGAFADIVALVRRYGADHVGFNVVEPRGHADELFEQVVPRYREVMRHADASGLDFNAPQQSLSRVPACAGGVEWVQDTWHLVRGRSVSVYDPAEGKIKGPPCRGCALDTSCPGIWQRYVEGYGWDDCVPLVDPGDREGQTLFVDTRSPCNNRCVHCVDGPAAAGTPAPVDAATWQLRRGWLRGYRRVEIGGGEPLLGTSLERLTALARSLQYREVALRTNGRMLAIPEQVARVRSLGIDEVIVFLNAGDGAVHDAMARAPRAFIQTLRGLQQLQEAKIPFEVRLRAHPRNRETIGAAEALATRVRARRFRVINP